MDQFHDFKKMLPSLAITTIFDVGANRGQSAREFRRACPDADIYAFEPVGGTFEMLSAAVQGDSKTRCFRNALGDRQATLKMAAKPGDLKNRIGDGDRGEDVDVIAGDQFCGSQGIESISFLKIDAEGYDLKVCQGFAGMFEAEAVDLVQVEAALNPQNTRHVPLEAFRDCLSPFGYSLFRMYDQDGTPVAMRCNAVFISRRLAARNPRVPRPGKRKHTWL
jgi:FkbM family methyltransferase